MLALKKISISAQSPSYKWWLGMALAIGSASVGFAERMIEIAIPQIMLAMNVSLDRVQWIRTAPAIVRTILGPLVGWLAGIFGARQLYIVSFILYIVCSGFAGAAWGLGVLIFFLALKNAGGGLRQPLSMSMMYRAFPPQQRGLAMGLYQASHMVGPLVAPLVGGWLVETFGWRSVFYVNIPINFISLILIMLVLPKDLENEKRAWPVSIDLLGLATMSLGLGALLWAINNGMIWGWDSSYIVGLFVAAAISFIVFVASEFRARYPILDVRVFANASFSLSFLARLLNTAIFQSTNFIFGIFLQRELRFSPLQAGQRLVPMAFTSAIGAIGWGMLSDRISIPVVVAVSLLASSVTMYLYSELDVGVSLAYIILVTVFQSLFRSGAQATMTTMALGTLPAEKATLGAGMDSLARNLGNTTGIPLIATYVTHRELVHLTKLMRVQTAEHEGQREALAAMQSAFQQAGQPLDEATARSRAVLRNRLIERAAIEAYHDSFRLAAVAGLFIIPMVLFIRSIYQFEPVSGRRPVRARKREPARAAD
ncbi:MAG TPA: DHA2 family efflux MFS transporter permease subunit [Candidatus Acidoferrales bacterium]|nr:DHA2 family efflux MFS transporter permease subunit [Candidatus Acidoferrales bacterium]